MARRADRTVPGGRVEARARLRAAGAYLESVELARAEVSRQEFSAVAVGNAVLSGIAATDSIGCSRLSRMHCDDDHRAAGQLLAQATPDGKALAVTLLRLLDMEDAAQYGATLISSRRASDAIKWAHKLVERAREEDER